jgi:alpha-galactosidase
LSPASRSLAKRALRLTTAIAALLLLGASTSAVRTSLHVMRAELGAKIVAESADAYVTYDEQALIWEIGNSSIARRMRFDPGGGYRLLALSNRRTGVEWSDPEGTASNELRLGLGGELITGADKRLKLKGYKTLTHPNGSLELLVSLADGPLSVSIHYLLFPWTSVFEQWVSVENTGSDVLRDLTTLDSISLSLRPSADPLTLYWVQGLSPQVENHEETQTLPVLRLRSLELEEGVSQELGSSARSSEDSMGWFALADNALREGLYGGIEWSGAWQLSAKREGGRTILLAGMRNLRRDLVPGEAFVSPRRFLGLYQGDLDDAANASHAFARTFLMHPLPYDFPWTTYNTWYAFGIDLDEERLRRQVDVAAELGLEVFYVDAGWYEGSPAQGDFGWGLGTWKENRDKFPSGLAAFSAYVHSKGMRFGLWVEPERVDMRYVGDGQEIPQNWLAPEGDALTAQQEGEELATTAQICLGHRPAREWEKSWLARLVRDYDLDWLKWDYNLWMSCDAPGEPGDANYAHIMGLYEVLDYLQTEFPNLIVENCASGGNRMDYGLMRRTDIAWLSDESEPSYRVRYHMTGASYPFPPEYLNTWLVPSENEPVDETTDPAKLRAWLRSRMMGAFGISMDIAGWPEEIRTVVANEIAQYKVMRPIITNGSLYRLLPQSELTIPDLLAPASPDGVEFWSSGENIGAVLLFQGAVPWRQRRVLLKGLEREMLYEVTSADRTMSLKMTGEELMTQGIRFRYEASQPSTLLFIKPAPPGSL